MSTRNARFVTEDVRVGVLTALPKEFAATAAMLENAADLPVANGRRSYKVGLVPSIASAGHVIALRQLPAMGNNLAATYATHFAEDFPNLREIIFVGIAGAAPNPVKVENHVRLGDVVVSGSNGVVQYDMLKQSAESTQFRGAPRAPSARLLGAVHQLQAAELAGDRAWLGNLGRTKQLAAALRPTPAEDRLMATPPQSGWVTHPSDDMRRPDEPRLFVGTIGSGNTLLKDPLKRDFLRDQHDLRAFEMEGSGLADACWTSECSYFVIRGTCDYCDANKNDVWQGYAAAVAAACLRGILAFCPASDSVRPRARSLLTAAQSLRQRIAARVNELRLYCSYGVIALLAGGSAGAIWSSRDSIARIAAFVIGGMIVGAGFGMSLLLGTGALQKTLAAKGHARYLHSLLATDRVDDILEELNAFLGR